MPREESPATPSLPWRASSMAVMALTGILSRAFLYGLSRTEVDGLEGFLRVLDRRKDVKKRDRGLITVSNHVSVLDDPVIWGVLPFRYMFDPDNLRWSLGSYDICFKNRFTSQFFTYGQTLPTHRLAHSPYGGLFQPTITQAIRLLSSGPFSIPPQPSPSLSPPQPSHPSPDTQPLLPEPPSDPFSSNHLTYTTNALDTFPSPSAYASRKHAWLHIFPEGKIHQKEDKTMRYLKWGVARLILESDPCPTIVPMWIDGPQEMMHESRSFPRFLPRLGKSLQVVFGDEVDTESVFGDLRERWRILKAREGVGQEVGILTEGLKYGVEAVELRKECTMRVREEVLKVRRKRGLPDEDPKAGLVETWVQEGGKREGRMKDGSWVKDT
ncbi:hypothetical protein M501DRAFT_1018746 [Patellaria atrata CBS 101060]|uniref:Tafazzin family protein n=1 Tax=Patellaria atrata CBS 101060 TaxID=1346257 RepID=A0A9P4S650_9PEZI|nr:hypothetical protein M501DRAFT_1018746 [Patellaria atrata CBS 101060]